MKRHSWGDLSVFLWFAIAAAGAIAWTYRAWFTAGVPLTAGDWGIQYPEAMRLFPLVPQAWNTQFGGGMGGNDLFLLALNTYYYTPIALLYRVIHVPWIWIERFLWYGPFVIAGASGAYMLAAEFAAPAFSLLGSVVYTVNTYALMIAGGGQMGVALGYAVAPWVYWGALRLFERLRRDSYVFWSVAAGFLFAVEFLFDLRLAYIAGIGLLLYAVFAVIRFAQEGSVPVFRIAVAGAVMVAVVLGIHAYWLIPFAMERTNPLVGLGDEFVNPGMVRFLSFAPFEHTLAFLHPNWPENVFGKIHFLRPEFLLIPIAAFGSLISVRKSDRRTAGTVLFFAALFLLGAFLSKGANEPVGAVYLWLFTHVPGFIMLRDPTKFYLLTALSVSVLIPYAAETGALWLKRRGMKAAVFAGVLAVWLLVHREAAAGTITGTFKPHPAPPVYGALAEYLSSERTFGRVLWVPMRERHGYASDRAPALSFGSFGIDSVASFVRWIGTPEAVRELSRKGVSHIIVPTDPGKELFLTNGKYDDTKRQKVLAALRKNPGVTEVAGFGGIGVFLLKQSYGHAFLERSPETAVPSEGQSPTRYRIGLPPVAADTRLTVSETYNPGWRLVVGGTGIPAERTADDMLSFALPAYGGGSAELIYGPQRLVTVLFFASVVFTGSLCAYLWFVRMRRGTAHRFMPFRRPGV